MRVIALLVRCTVKDDIQSAEKKMFLACALLASGRDVLVAGKIVVILCGRYQQRDSDKAPLLDRLRPVSE